MMLILSLTLPEKVISQHLVCEYPFCNDRDSRLKASKASIHDF